MQHPNQNPPVQNSYLFKRNTPSDRSGNGSRPWLDWDVPVLTLGSCSSSVGAVSFAKRGSYQQLLGWAPREIPHPALESRSSFSAFITGRIKDRCIHIVIASCTVQLLPGIRGVNRRC